MQRKDSYPRNSLHAKRSHALNQAIDSAKESKSELEIIIRIEEGRKEEVARQLQRIGTVRHVYELVPYLSLRCDADYVDILRKASSGDVSDSVFERTFRSIIPAIAAIDFSNAISIPKASPPAVVSKNRRIKVKSELWNLEAIGAYEAQQYGNGDGIAVAVVDSGVDYNHSQLLQRFSSSKGYDFVKNNDEPLDENGHGTHVSGIIAASDYGVATGCKLYSVRVLDANGSGTEADAIAGIEWCIKNGIYVANMSFGGPVASQALEEVCRYAWQQRIILVAAAGNNGYGPNYPAAFGEPIIAVAAVDENLQHPDFSSIWETNDISAPGVGIASTYINEGYARLSGTSMAAPHVTGSLALALSIASGEEESLEEMMKKTADSNGFDEPEVFGAGLVRADRMAKHLAENGYVRGRRTSPQLLQAPLLRGYFDLEKAVDTALNRFAKDAVAEAKRWFS